MNEVTIRIEGIEELTQAVLALAGSMGGQQVPQMTAQPTQAPQGAPVQPTAPTTAPAPVTPQVPVTVAPQQYTFDQLAVALSNLCANMGKQPEVHALLAQFGVNALFDLPKERYGDFAVALRGIGGVI